jgi:hypothetical protein
MREIESVARPEIACMKNACMNVSITIRDVPQDVRDALADKAEREGKSMQEYLRGELARLAYSPSMDSWLDAVRERRGALPQQGYAQPGAVRPRRGPEVTLPVQYTSPYPSLDRIWELRHNITAYDACYVTLAELLGRPWPPWTGRLPCRRRAALF